MTIEERTFPSTIGCSQHVFCSGVPTFSSTSMLPSSGAAQLHATGPKRERPSSSYTAAMPTVGRPWPPRSFGICGHHRPLALASARSSPSRSRRTFSPSPNEAGSASAGSSTSSTKRFAWRRTASTSAGSVRSTGLLLLHERGGREDLVLHRLDERHLNLQELLPLGIGRQRGPLLRPVVDTVVAPQVHDLVQHSDVHRDVPAERGPEILALQRQADPLVAVDIFLHLAGMQRVSPVVDDHASLPRPTAGGSWRRPGGGSSAV